MREDGFVSSFRRPLYSLYHARRRDWLLMVLTHNIITLLPVELLLLIQGFLQSSSDLFADLTGLAFKVQS